MVVKDPGIPTADHQERRTAEFGTTRNVFSRQRSSGAAGAAAARHPQAICGKVWRTDRRTSRTRSWVCSAIGRCSAPAWVRCAGSGRSPRVWVRFVLPGPRARRLALFRKIGFPRRAGDRLYPDAVCGAGRKLSGPQCDTRQSEADPPVCVSGRKQGRNNVGRGEPRPARQLHPSCPRSSRHGGRSTSARSAVTGGSSGAPCAAICGKVLQSVAHGPVSDLARFP